MRLHIPNFISSIPYDKLNTSRDKQPAPNRPTRTQPKSFTLSLDNLHSYPFSPLQDPRKPPPPLKCSPQKSNSPSQVGSNRGSKGRPSRTEIRERCPTGSQAQRWHHPDVERRRRSRTVPPKPHVSLLGSTAASILLVVWTILCVLANVKECGE